MVMALLLSIEVSGCVCHIQYTVKPPQINVLQTDGVK